MPERLHEPLEEALRRLRRERDEADRRYNDALTALDQAAMRMPDLPHPPPPYDEQQIGALNQSWNITARPARSGLKGRLTDIVWRLVGPSLQSQTEFNSRLVDHLNRNADAHREAQRAIASTIELIRSQLSDLMAFQSRLILYLQQITGYVDTKDRDVAGQSLIVNAAVNGVADDLAKRWESMVVREQRFDSKVGALMVAQEQLRASVGIAQQATLTMKRELERLVRLKPDTSEVRLKPDSTSDSDRSVRLTPDHIPFGQGLEAYKYVGFEDQFRGSQETIRQRLESYLPYFAGAADVLDAGCGRGEFLDLLKTHGVGARGLDLNHEMVELCRARGLDVAEGDVVRYLEGLPDASLGGLFAAQVVEHLQPAYLLRFLELAYHKLRPGAPLVLDTLNPACWVAFFDSFIRDITHVWPLHPETLRYLVLASGFGTAQIAFRSPVPPEDRLQTVAVTEEASELVEPFNANVEKLNARLFTFLDYAIVAVR